MSDLACRCEDVRGESCYVCDPIPGTRPLPTDEQLVDQWEQIETQLAEAVRAGETP